MWVKAVFSLFITIAACSHKEAEDTKPIPISSASSLHEEKAELSLNSVEMHSMKKFAVFYGDPLYFSLPPSVPCYTDKEICISSQLSTFSFVVVGAGLEEEKHHSHLFTKRMIQAPSKTKYYGYLDLGKTKNFPLSELLLRVEKWKEMGVDGILIDEAGFEYWDHGGADFRARLNMVLDRLHNFQLKAIVNAWNPSDVFTKIPENPVHWNSDDGYLLEGYSFSTEAISFDSYRKKMDACLAAKRKFHINLYGVITSDRMLSHKLTKEKWKFFAISAHFDQLDGVAWADDSFSSYDSKLTIPNDDFIEVGLDKSERTTISIKERKLSRRVYLSTSIGNALQTYVAILDYTTRSVFERALKKFL